MGQPGIDMMLTCRKSCHAIVMRAVFLYVVGVLGGRMAGKGRLIFMINIILRSPYLVSHLDTGFERSTYIWCYPKWFIENLEIHFSPKFSVHIGITALSLPRHVVYVVRRQKSRCLSLPGFCNCRNYVVCFLFRLLFFLPFEWSLSERWLFILKFYHTIL